MQASGWCGRKAGSVCRHWNLALRGPGAEFRGAEWGAAGLGGILHEGRGQAPGSSERALGGAVGNSGRRRVWGLEADFYPAKGGSVERLTSG